MHLPSGHCACLAVSGPHISPCSELHTMSRTVPLQAHWRPLPLQLSVGAELSVNSNRKQMLLTRHCLLS